MGGMRDLMASERGVFCLAVLAFATALVILNKIAGDTWVSLTMAIAGMLVTSKTITNHIDAKAANGATH